MIEILVPWRFLTARFRLNVDVRALVLVVMLGKQRQGLFGFGDHCVWTSVGEVSKFAQGNYECYCVVQDKMMRIPSMPWRVGASRILDRGRPAEQPGDRRRMQVAVDGQTVISVERRIETFCSCQFPNSEAAAAMRWWRSKASKVVASASGSAKVDATVVGCVGGRGEAREGVEAMMLQRYYKSTQTSNYQKGK